MLFLVIQYSLVLNHWEPLTLVLRVPGSPLDSTIVERALKKAILHRRNSLFYKTQRGARVGGVCTKVLSVVIPARDEEGCIAQPRTTARTCSRFIQHTRVSKTLRMVEAIDWRPSRSNTQSPIGLLRVRSMDDPNRLVDTVPRWLLPVVTEMTLPGWEIPQPWSNVARAGFRYKRTEVGQNPGLFSPRTEKKLYP